MALATYCEPTDVSNRLKQSGYLNLADLDQDGSVSIPELAANVTTAIRWASNRIAYALANRNPPYDVTAVPAGAGDFLLPLAVDLAVWYLASNGGGEIPDSFQTAYEEAVKALEAISEGSIIPGTDAKALFDLRAH